MAAAYAQQAPSKEYQFEPGDKAWLKQIWVGKILPKATGPDELIISPMYTRW